MPPHRQAGRSGSGGGSKKKGGSHRKKGGGSRKGKKPVVGQKQIMDRQINVLKIVDVPKSDFSSESCQIGIERSDYLGDKISVGVARPSHVLGQSVPCDG